MKKTAVIRTVIFIVFILFLAYSAVCYGYEYYRLSVGEVMENINNAENMIIDGTDMTDFFKFTFFTLTGFMAFMLNLFTCLIMLAFSLLLMLPLSLIGIRKNSTVTRKEYNIARITLAAVAVLSIPALLIVTRGGFVISFLLYTAVWVLISFLIYILRLRSKYKATLAAETAADGSSDAPIDGSTDALDDGAAEDSVSDRS